MSPTIHILSGGVGPERDIALVTGESMESALREQFPVELRILDEPALPATLDPAEGLVFPALHGEFGEDGGLQALLEERGFIYAGSDARASRLCIQKSRTKGVAEAAGVGVVPGRRIGSGELPSAEELIRDLGPDLVVKPDDKGSSVGLYLVEGREELRRVLDEREPGEWLVEQRIRGRELSVGLLHGKAMGVVELLPTAGVYDFESKYTPGRTDYRFPAEIEPVLEDRVRSWSETVFTRCGCRDFARADFMLSSAGEPYFLEINTLPGLTPTSLLPKSASCRGFSFPELAKELVLPAIRRFHNAERPKEERLSENGP